MFIGKIFLVLAMHWGTRYCIYASKDYQIGPPKWWHFWGAIGNRVVFFSITNNVWTCTTMHFDAMHLFMFFWTINKLLMILFSKNRLKSTSFFSNTTYEQFSCRLTLTNFSFPNVLSYRKIFALYLIFILAEKNSLSLLRSVLGIPVTWRTYKRWERDKVQSRRHGGGLWWA